MRNIDPTAGFPISPLTVYDDDALRLGLHLSQAAIDDARRSGRLRSTHHGSRTFYLGAWVLAWLEESCQGAAAPVQKAGEA